MTFGQKLSKLRERNEDTQENLAEKLSVSPQTVRRWEHDKNLPNVNQLKIICDTYNVSPNYFFEDENEIAANKAKEISISYEEETRRNNHNAALLIIGVVFTVILFSVLLI